MSRKHRHKLNGIERYYTVLICCIVIVVTFHKVHDNSQIHKKMNLLH